MLGGMNNINVKLNEIREIEIPWDKKIPTLSISDITPQASGSDLGAAVNDSSSPSQLLLILMCKNIALAT